MTTIDPALLSELGLTRPPTTPVDDAGSQDQFMTLLLAQFENQDPFEPMENGEFLTQLAQFETATGIEELQNSFADFSNTIYSDQALQASSLVGRDLLVAAEQALTPAAGGGVSGLVSITGGSGTVTVDVIDSAGQLVNSLDLGVRTAGDAAFEWNGLRADGTPAAAGAYRFEARVARPDQVERVPTLLRTRADSVTLGGSGNGVTVNSSQLGAFSLDDVRQIF